MDKKRSIVFLLALLLMLAAALLSLLLGAAGLSLRQLWDAVCKGPSDTAGRIFWYARLPRTAACLLSGAALAVSGAVIQTVLHNQLASPGIIGVNSGAGLAVTVCCACGMLSGWAVAIAAFAGAVGAVLLVVFLARKTGASRTTVILGGVAVGGLLTALSEAVTTLVPEASLLSGDFRVGGFGAVSHLRLIPAGILICSALLIILSMTNELDVLALGEQTAGSLGIPVRRMRTLFLILAALLAGASVSVAGLLGFVGLLVPHMGRKLVGGECRYLVPLCALGGAGFVALCDVAARMIFAPHEFPVGILMSVIGGPCFMLLLIRRRGGISRA